ncbi:Nif3-like dinuclear metal center hexameric protein, partial [Staphylococcus epidermidis]|uniref:Nif3-like dinuclear metal center hexameric protein n=1 Tax=Staphylococcus epidermidis TaxID=1282 RepID=UPI0016427841
QTMTLDQFSQYPKKHLNIPTLPYTPQHHTPINKLAIIPPSPIPFEYKPTQLPPHLFVTPDIKHHHPLDPKIQNLNLLDI